MFNYTVGWIQLELCITVSMLSDVYLQTPENETNHRYTSTQRTLPVAAGASQYCAEQHSTSSFRFAHRRVVSFWSLLAVQCTTNYKESATCVYRCSKPKHSSHSSSNQRIKWPDKRKQVLYKKFCKICFEQNRECLILRNFEKFCIQFHWNLKPSFCPNYKF